MSAFNRQLEQLIPPLRRFSRSLLADPMLADDLVQDTLERALRHQHRWQPGTNLRAWLFTIAHNLYANQLRASRPLLPDGDLLVQDERAAQSEGDPRAQEIRQRFDALPFQQREVLALVAIEGFSYEQVAQIIGVPRGTVMSRLSRARENMRQPLSHPPQRLRRVK